MPNAELQSYVASARAVGGTDAAIRAALLSTGWPKADVDAALSPSPVAPASVVNAAPADASPANGKRVAAILGVVVLVGVTAGAVGIWRNFGTPRATAPAENTPRPASSSDAMPDYGTALPGEPITVAVIGEKTRRDAELMSVSGAVLAADDVNRAGGIGGSPLKVSVRESACETAALSTAYDAALRDDHAVLVFVACGPTGNAETEAPKESAVDAVAAKSVVAKIPMVATCPIPRRAIADGFVFGALGPYAGIASVAQDAAARGIKDAVVVTDVGSPNNAPRVSRFFVTQFEATGGRITAQFDVGRAFGDGITAELSKAANAVAAVQPKLVFVSADPGRVRDIVKSIRQKFPGAAFAAGEAFDDANVFANPDAEGLVYVGTPAPAPETRRNSRMMVLRDTEGRGMGTSNCEMNAFVDTLLVGKLLNDGARTGDALRAALAATKGWPAINGQNLTVDAYGNIIDDAAKAPLMVTTGGKAVVRPAANP